MIPPRRSIPVDYETKPEVTGDWPEFADELRVPGAGFWLTLLGGCLFTVTAIAISLWALA